ncbi:MAG: hypothetical protein ACHQF2_06695 [Flavobacteriales bacterium]
MKKIYSLLLVGTLGTGFSAQAYNPHHRATSILPGASIGYMRLTQPMTNMTGNAMSWGFNGDFAWELQIPKFSHIMHVQTDVNYYLMPGKCGQVGASTEGMNRKGWGVGITGGFFHESGIGLNVGTQAIFLNGMRSYGVKAGPSYLNIFNVYAGYMQNHLRGEGTTTKTGHFTFGLELNINFATGIAVLD